MKQTLRGVASGLAGLASVVFSVGGCQKPLQKNERDAMALWGFVGMGSGAQRNSPTLYHAGREMVRQAQDEDVQQNVNVYHNYSNQRTEFCTIPFNQTFSCRSLDDFDGDGIVSDCEIHDQLEHTFSTYQKVILAVKTRGDLNTVVFFLMDNHGAEIDRTLVTPTKSGNISTSYLAYDPNQFRSGDYYFNVDIDGTMCEVNKFTVK